MSTKRLFNDKWNFTKQSLGTSIDQFHSFSNQFESVDLPHDWLIYQNDNLYEDSEGWYKRTLHLSIQDLTSHYALRFEGVYMDSTLYINRTKAFEWKYGYSTFECDITDFLVPGENEILMQVRHQAPNSRWYSGAGIYRNVWLKTYSFDHFLPDGIYISTKKLVDGFRVDISAELQLSEHTSDDITIHHTIFDGKEPIAKSSTILQSHNISEYNSITSQCFVSSPKLWDIESPNLYELHSELYVGTERMDEEWNRFGFRTIEYTPQHGFLLNDRNIKIQGTCEHHDLGCLGAAVNREALHQRLLLLREMGVNAIRTSHNMPSVELMELADEMGFLINSEAFDMWERSKTTYDYARFFDEWSEKDVASWIRRDRNHPSVIMWSIGNEIYDTHADKHGQDITRRLMSYVQKHDYRNNAPVTIGSNYMPWENARKCADIVKLAGYNYAEKYYEEHHKLHPDWMIYGSETSSTVQSRGIYHFPLSQSILADDDEQCSSLGNSSTSWGAKNTEYCIIADRDASFSAGQFIWTGFDYIGEPTPYHTKNSYFGQLDTAGFKKDSYYVYQAEWTSAKDAPMIHLFPYWDFSDGQMIDVRACTNAPSLEVFFNDESKGRFYVDHKHGTQLIANYRIPYQKGILKAVAYNEQDDIIATDVRQSFGNAVSIQLSPNKTSLAADGQDLIFVEISTIDANGVPVENATNRINITVSGAGRLIGLDNGDSTDYESYKGTSRRLFSGKLMAVIASKTEAGDIHVHASSAGLLSAELTLHAFTCTVPVGISASTENQPSEENNEVPVRKIEIISPSGTKLTKEKCSVTAYAKIYPENSSYKEVEWRITNAAGVDTNLATFTTEGNQITISALGDGDIYLRCYSKNGRAKSTLISQLEFTCTGIGKAALCPYDFISGSLYTFSSFELTNGNERGIATPRGVECHIAFSNLDFGEFGSDEVTIPIFSLDNEPVPLQFYEGIPYQEGSQLIGEAVYNKPSIWNVYQEETFHLNKRLHGITTLGIVVHQKIHIKGFHFSRQYKAYYPINATDYDCVYGDSYHVTSEGIEGIGNNVSLEYHNLEFDSSGSSKILICGHSPIDKNTIHIRFSNEHGIEEYLAEFVHSTDYAVKEFNLPPQYGKKTLTLLFLPGSNFDLKWFQFAPRT